jgi:hypothetical protein
MMIYSLSNVLPAKFATEHNKFTMVLKSPETCADIIRGLQGKAQHSHQNEAYCLTDENIEAAINAIDGNVQDEAYKKLPISEFYSQEKLRRKFRATNLGGFGRRLLRKNGRMVPLSSDYHGAVKAALEDFEGAAHQPDVKKHMEEVQRVSFLDKWVFGELFEKMIAFHGRFLSHQDADAEFSGSKSSMLVKHSAATEMDRTVLFDEAANQRALASRLKVEEDLAEAAKHKAEADKNTAEAMKCNANVVDKLVDNLLGRNLALAKAKEEDQGVISAINDLGKTFTKQLHNSTEELTQVQHDATEKLTQVHHKATEKLTQGQQDLAREFKTPYKAKPPSLEVTTSPAPTHPLVFQTPVRVHVPAQGPNFCKCKILCDFHLFPPIYSSHLMICER